MENRLHIPKLRPEQIGVYDLPGWYLEDSHFFANRQEVVFQCKFGHSASMPHHSIDTNGVVNASMLCWCGKFHEWVVFDNWPKELLKKAGNQKQESYCVEPA